MHFNLVTMGKVVSSLAGRPIAAHLQGEAGERGVVGACGAAEGEFLIVVVLGTI